MDTGLHNELTEDQFKVIKYLANRGVALISINIPKPDEDEAKDIARVEKSLNIFKALEAAGFLQNAEEVDESLIERNDFARITGEHEQAVFIVTDTAIKMFRRVPKDGNEEAEYVN